MTFHEQWYSEAQGNKVADLARQCPRDGRFVEIGSWEGFSSVKIANAIYPQNLFCIDHWQGNVEESATHPSVIAARDRDVYATFIENCFQLTKGNIIPIRQSWQSAWPLLFYKEPIAFCHIDAAHDYMSVLKTLEVIWPQVISNGIICGDDFQTASAQRIDLNGGVERAVREYFAGENLQTEHNLWWVIRSV